MSGTRKIKMLVTGPVEGVNCRPGDVVTCDAEVAKWQVTNRRAEYADSAAKRKDNSAGSTDVS